MTVQAAMGLASGPRLPYGAVVVTPGKWTAKRALEELPETTGMIIEVFDGSLVASPRPSEWHQVVLRELGYQLNKAARRAGLTALPEINLVLGEDLVDPDITVTPRSRNERVWFHGADTVLIVEIMSPNHKRLELIDRPKRYAGAGIPYYLRVENRGGRPVLLLHELAGDRYEVIAEAAAGTTFSMAKPFEFSIDPAALLDD